MSQALTNIQTEHELRIQSVEDMNPSIIDLSHVANRSKQVEQRQRWKGRRVVWRLTDCGQTTLSPAPPQIASRRSPCTLCPQDKLPANCPQLAALQSNISLRSLLPKWHHSFTEFSRFNLAAATQSESSLQSRTNPTNPTSSLMQLEREFEQINKASGNHCIEAQR